MRKIIFYCLLALGLIAVCGYSYYMSKDKIVFVDLNKLYDGFLLKKELENKYKKQEENIQGICDSLRVEVVSLERKLTSMKNTKSQEAEEYMNKRNMYIMNIKKFEENKNKLVEGYDGQIYSQLMQYVNDFGEENGYDYILGMDGSGYLLYSSSKKEITKELIKYVNQRHNGELSK